MKLIVKDDFEQKNNLIQIETNESLYSFKIQIKEEEINEPYINIYAYLKGSNSKILIQEGYQYTDKLTEGNDKITYSLLFVNGEFNEDMKYICQEVLK